jgi:replicative DNA helicase
MNSVYSINIERTVLSSILFNQEEMEDIINVLKPSDFYLPAHQIVYEVMTRLYYEEMPIDEEFIIKRLSTKEVDESILLEIMATNPITNTVGYVKEIKDSALKRELVSVATMIKKVCIEDDISAADAFETIQDEFYKIADNDNSVEFKELNLIVKDFADKFKILSQDKKPIGIRTGIRQFGDNLIFEPGDLVIIAARPSMGKTSLLLTMIKNWIKNDIGVIFDSLEMPNEKIMRRLMATINQESLTDLKRGVVKDLSKYHETLKFLSNTKNLILHDKSYVPISYLKTKVKKVLRKNPHIKVWAIDHLKYIKSKGINRALEVSEITKEMKSIAKEFGLVVVALSQLRRLDDKSTVFRPQLTDLRDSGAIEEDADIIIFPHRESYYKRTSKNEKETPINDAELIVGKNRDGESNTIKLQFNGPTNTFGDFYEVSYTNQSGDISSETEIIDDGGMSIIMD